MGKPIYEDTVNQQHSQTVSRSRTHLSFYALKIEITKTEEYDPRVPGFLLSQCRDFFRLLVNNMLGMAKLER